MLSLAEENRGQSSDVFITDSQAEFWAEPIKFYYCEEKKFFEVTTEFLRRDVHNWVCQLSIFIKWGTT